MKGLLLKDFYMMWKNFRFYFVMCVIFLIFGIMVKNNFFMLFYPAFVCSLMPMNILSFDEKSGWDRYSLCFPLSRTQLVSARYLFSLLLAGGIFLLYVLGLVFKVCILEHSPAELWPTLAVYLPALAGMMFLPQSIIFPGVLKFGTQKGSIAYYLALGVIVGVGVAVLNVFDTLSPAAVDFNDISRFLWLLPLAAALLYALSWPLSARIYEKKDF